MDDDKIKEKEEYHRILVATSKSALNVYLQSEGIDPTVIEYQKKLVKMNERMLSAFYRENGMDENGKSL